MEQLKTDVDRAYQQAISEKIELLRSNPVELGKPLVDELAGYFRIVAAGRYRVIYKILEDPDDGLAEDPSNKELLGRVQVVCIGIRKDGDKKDAYAIARRLAIAGDLA